MSLETRIRVAVSAAALACLAACATSSGKTLPKVDLAPAREAVEAARAAGAEARAPEPFTKARGHLNEAESLLTTGADEERARRAEMLARIATVEAGWAADVARLQESLAQRAAPSSPSPEAEKLTARVKKADEDQRRLEDRISVLQRDLEMTETEVIRTKARLKGTETKAEASSAIAEARILMRRLADDKRRSAALARCNELLARAEDLLRQENFGAAAFFALKAQDAATKAEEPTPAAAVEAERPAPQKAYTVKATLANLRRTPTTGASVVATAPKGAVLEALAISGDWIKVKTGVVVAWVHRSLVE